MSFPLSARALIWQTCLPRFATFVSPLMSLKGLPCRRNDAAKDTDTLPAAGLPAPSTFSTFCSDPSASLTEPSRAMAFFASSMTCFASAGVQVAWSAWLRGRKVVGAWNAAACSRHSAPTIRRIIVLPLLPAGTDRC